MQGWIVSLPERLDVFLAKDAHFASREKVQAAIEAGHVTVNDAVITKPSHRLQEGDEVELTTDEPMRSDTSIKAADLHLVILYEDDTCFVIDKPAGIAVHPGAGIPDEEATILHGAAYLYQKGKIPFFADSVLVHRLDRDTTGCLLIAKSPEAHRALQNQFQQRSIRKIYLAVVAGIPSPPSAVIDAPIGRATAERTKMSITGVSKTREARTTYRTIATSRQAALLECELHTGRTHQLRVHLSAIGHPILGDPKYSSLLSERLTDEFAIHNLCLHAKQLTFVSPADGKEHIVRAQLPEAFHEVGSRIGIALP